MARPQKVNLNTFTLSVISDKKQNHLQAQHGLAGLGLYIKLLQVIFAQGYYIHLEAAAVENLKLEAQLSGIIWQNYLQTLAILDIIDRDMLIKHQVITGKEIQRQYISATKRRKHKPTLYILEDPEEKHKIEDGFTHQNIKAEDIFPPATSQAPTVMVDKNLISTSINTNTVSVTQTPQNEYANQVNTPPNQIIVNKNPIDDSGNPYIYNRLKNSREDSSIDKEEKKLKKEESAFLQTKTSFQNTQKPITLDWFCQLYSCRKTIRLETHWLKLTDQDKVEIQKRLPIYLTYNPNPTFRKSPVNYLNPATKFWQEDLIDRRPKSETNTQTNQKSTKSPMVFKV